MTSLWVWSIAMRYEIDEKITTMNYQHIRPLPISGIYMQNCKMFIESIDAKHASGKYYKFYFLKGT